MGRVKPSKHEIFLNYKLWLSSITGEGIIDEDQYKILKYIQDKGTLKAAADELGISYRKAWGDIKKAEELLGYDLTNKKRGGKSGGHSELTEKAIKLLEAYQALQVKMDDAVEDAYSDFKNKISE